MKIIVAGGREFNEFHTLSYVLNDLVPSVFNSKITELVSGNARGADKLGELWAQQYKIPVVLFKANWAKYGRGAGKLRNREMAEYAEGLVAFWDGHSRGTGHMIDTARELKLKTYVYLYVP